MRGSPRCHRPVYLPKRLDGRGGRGNVRVIYNNKRTAADNPEETPPCLFVVVVVAYTHTRRVGRTPPCVIRDECARARAPSRVAVARACTAACPIPLPWLPAVYGVVTVLAGRRCRSVRAEIRNPPSPRAVSSVSRALVSHRTRVSRRRRRRTREGTVSREHDNIPRVRPCPSSPLSGR